jgi:hypothetical protein
MDEDLQSDPKILTIKKNKSGKVVKKVPMTSKLSPNESNRSDSNNLIGKNNLHFNMNKAKMGQNNQMNYQDSENWNIMKSSLEKIQEVIIKQESDILEAVTGCQEPNNYHIYGRFPNGEKCYIFRCKEFSSCPMRCCCPVSCRELIMKIKIAYDEKENEDENDNDEEFNNSFLYIEKKFKCPCCNCIRPEMRVFITETNTLLGTIEEGFSCCDPIFNVYDKDGKVIYNIETDCCQCGFMCRNNCWGKTDECVFFIYDAEKRSNAIGEISKKAAASQLSIADNYSVLFPTNATLEQKILLTVAGVMIDYQYFENNTNTVK